MLLSDNILIVILVMKPCTMRFLSFGAVKCIGLCMRLD